MSYRFSTELSAEEYEAFASKHALYNIYQSAPWAIVKKEWHHAYTGIYENGTLVAVGLLLYRDLPLHRTLFYLPKGPLIDFSNQELLRYYFSELKRYGKQKHAILIRIDPHVLLSSVPYTQVKETLEVRQSPVIDALCAIGFRHHGFNKDMYETAQPRYTACYYYTDGWLENYHAKAIKSIRKAEKKGVELEVIGPEQLDIFSALMSCTEKRKNISLRSKEYYQRICDAYGENAYLVVTKLNVKEQLTIKKETARGWKETIEKKEIAEYKLAQLRDQLASLEKDIAFEEELKKEGDVVYISCLLAVKTGNTTELLYAGMDERYRKYLATYMSYFAGIRWGYEQGCTRCDFGGIEGTLDDGLTEFKSYFDPNIDEYIGEFDMPLHKLLYWGFTKGVPLYKSVRRYFRGKKK